MGTGSWDDLAITEGLPASEWFRRGLTVETLLADGVVLTINPRNCGDLSIINSSSGRYVEPFSPKYGDDQEILALLWEDT